MRCPSFIFRRPVMLGFSFVAGLSPQLWAQQTSNPDSNSAIEVYNSQRPSINYSEGGIYREEDLLNPYNTGAPYNPYYSEPYPQQQRPIYNPNAPYIPGQEVVQSEPKSISRLSGGLFLNATNVGIIHSLFKQTNDSIYAKSNASEFGFGIGGFLDFAIPDNPGAIRIKAGATRVQIKPNTQTRSAYTGAQLENSETLFNASVMLRLAAPSDMLGFGIFWGGVGVQMLDAMSTSRFDSSGNRSGGSKIANSYGYSPFLAVGAEVPFTSTEDFTFSVDWLPWKGFSGMAGLKTAL